MGIAGRDKFSYRIKSIWIFVGLLLVGAINFVSTQAHPAVSYGESLVDILSGLWTGSQSFFVTASGLFSAVIGGALFALGQNRILANVLLCLLLVVDIMLLFSLTPQRVYQKLEQPLEQLAYLIRRNHENTLEKKEREAEDRQGRAVNPRERSSRNIVADDTRKNQRIAATESTRRTRGAKNIPQEAADDFEQSAKSPVTAASTKALIEEFEKDTAPAKDKDSVIYKPIPDLFAVADSEIADIFTVAQAQEPAKTVPPIINTPFAPAVQTTQEIAETSLVVEQKKAATEKAEPVEALSEAEKQAAKEELDAALESAEETEIVYELPPIDILSKPKQQANVNNEAELQGNGEKLIAALKSFNVAASIQAIVPGPTVTRYELSPAPGVKISRFVSLADDLALHLAAPAGLRIEAPIPNKAAIGIEVPNKSRRVIAFREIIDTKDYRKSSSKLNAGLGKDIAGNIICCDIAKMPHLLVAGTTGSGKSVCMNTMICSLLYNATPDEVKLLLIDPKQVEFSIYNGIPHLLVPVVSDPRKAAGALAWAVTEMLSRYKTLNANGARDIGAYNQMCDENEGMKKMPQIVIFIDELSDLMTVAPSEVEDSIQRLAQMARAAGMHLVIATQRPSVDVITGVIKANIPSRIALSVSSQVDSRTIIDSVGAEKLMGYGDMLYYPVGVPKPMRVQGAFLSDDDIFNVVNFIKSQGSTNYSDDVQQEIERNAVQEKKKGGAAVTATSGDVDDAYEELVQKAIELFVGTPEKASVSSLQRHLRLGYSKAGSLMDVLEERGIVGPSEGSKPRKVLITKAQWYEMQANSADAPAAESTEDVPFEPDVNADE
ncbi:MAG: DNA translocase FtsK [Clostridia bacterium]|nr:DNA translocase FtsK [Clostridia bacterium]